MKILGIDPGLAIVGFGVIVKNKNKIKLLASGCVLTSKDESVYERIGAIYEDIVGLIEKYKPDVVICEELFYFKNAKTVINVAQARGVIMLAAKKMNVPFFEYTPLQIKQALTGYGRADKRQIQEMTKSLLGLSGYLKPDDVADAVASAICHANCAR